VLVTGVYDMDLQPECASCRLQVFRLGFGIRTIRVYDCTYDVGLRYQLSQQSQPLFLQPVD